MTRNDDLPEGGLTLVAEPTQFVFGGVAFEMCPAPDVRWAMGREHGQFAAEYSVSPVAAAVRCVVSAAPELSFDGDDREIRWEWTGDVARVTTCRVRAELRRLGTGYVATARVAPSEAGCSALVTALSAAIVHREGGFVLHAAGVLLEGRAVLFIGPSGAGKTTASNHCQGAHWIARDRAAVYPTPLGWYAAGMAGGDALDLPRAPTTLAPLGAILRIRRGTARLVDPGLSSNVRNLRESVTAAPSSAGEESARLDALLELATAASVGELAFELDRPLRPLLHTWMGGGER